MELTQLTKIMRDSGVAGAGGAGFPSYAKLDKRADTIILNCAECEPLLKLHRQVLEKFALEILTALELIRETVEAEQVIIAVKSSYKGAIAAVNSHLSKFKHTKIGILPEIYPAGDEVVTIYETTGRVVAPGALPITVGVTVFNVETALNVYYAVQEQKGVTFKYITIAGEVKNPTTFKAPLGMTYGELIALAGGATVEDPVLIAGGPMTGRVTSAADVVTKTSNAILVLPKNQYVAKKKLTPIKMNMQVAMAACCQCRMCTDLCSRNLLGHPIEPHRFMRALTNGKTDDTPAYMNTFFCSGCGLCEMYSCGQGLSPASLIGKVKGSLRASGVTPPKDAELKPVSENRKYSRVPMARLTARLGLTKYNVPAPLKDELLDAASVKIMLSQSIGAPSVACVKAGDTVVAGQMIGAPAEGKLSTAVHASICGTVSEVTDKYVLIRK
ncbi:MAG: SLBB domain-containing protein [Clostridia bacterium]|nr:SLBB domain-containing protein [Clostridia bacterium]